MRALLTALVVVFAATSCRKDAFAIDESVTLVSVGKQEAKWNAAGIKSYSFQQEKLCNCNGSAKATLTVVNGVLTSGTFVADGAPIPAGIRNTYLTVPELFSLVRSLLAQKPAALEVIWDEPLGYPAQIIVNIDPNSKLDDFVLTTSNFVRTPAAR